MNCNANRRAGWGAGGAQTGCQIAAARLCLTCLSLPCGVCTISLLQVFFSPLTRAQQLPLSFSLLSANSTKSKHSLGRLMSNINIRIRNPKLLLCWTLTWTGDSGASWHLNQYPINNIEWPADNTFYEKLLKFTWQCITRHSYTIPMWHHLLKALTVNEFVLNQKYFHVNSSLISASPQHHLALGSHLMFGYDLFFIVVIHLDVGVSSYDTKDVFSLFISIYLLIKDYLKLKSHIGSTYHDHS